MIKVKLRELEKASRRLKTLKRQKQQFFVDPKEVEKYRKSIKEIKKDILSDSYVSEETIKNVIWNSEWDEETVTFLLQGEEWSIVWLLGDMWGTTVWEFITTLDYIPIDLIKAFQNANPELVKAVKINVPQLKKFIDTALLINFSK